MKQMSNLNYAMFLLWYYPQLAAIILAAIIIIPLVYMAWIINPLAGVTMVDSFAEMVQAKTAEVRKAKARLQK